MCSAVILVLTVESNVDWVVGAFPHFDTKAELLDRCVILVFRRRLFLVSRQTIPEERAP